MSYRFPHTREIHKKTGQIVYAVQKFGGKQRYDTVTYVGRDKTGERIEISAKDYRFYMPAYKIGDVIENYPTFQKVITGLTKKSKNVCIAEITFTYTQRVGIHDKGETRIYNEELEARIIE